MSIVFQQCVGQLVTRSLPWVRTLRTFIIRNQVWKSLLMLLQNKGISRQFTADHPCFRLIVNLKSLNYQGRWQGRSGTGQHLPLPSGSPCPRSSNPLLWAQLFRSPCSPPRETCRPHGPCNAPRSHRFSAEASAPPKSSLPKWGLPAPHRAYPQTQASALESGRGPVETFRCLPITVHISGQDFCHLPYFNLTYFVLERSIGMFP